MASLPFFRKPGISRITRIQSEETMNTPKPDVFKLFQRRKEVEILDPDVPDSPVTLSVSKPTSEQLERGTRFLFQRAKFWLEDEESDVARQTEDFLKNFPDREALIDALLTRTLGERVEAEIDLLDPLARREIDWGFLKTLTPAQMAGFWGVRPGGAEQLEYLLSVKAAGIDRTDLTPIFIKKEDFLATLDRNLRDELHRRHYDRERKTYEGQSLEQIREALSFVNRRTIAYSYAQEEYVRYMIALLTFFPDAPGEKGSRVFSTEPKDPNYFGHASPDLLRALAPTVLDFLGLGSMMNARKLAEDPNFPVSATSPQGSESLPQGAGEPSTS